MILQCPRCRARTRLSAEGIITRPNCARCGLPLPMPSATLQPPPRAVDRRPASGTPQPPDAKR